MSVDESLGLIDYPASSDPHLLERNRLVPEPVHETRGRGGEETWITAEAARRPHLFAADGEPLEVFKFFPPAPRGRP